MAKQIINSTDILNVGRIKINENFTELYLGKARIFADDSTVVMPDALEVEDLHRAKIITK